MTVKPTVGCSSSREMTGLWQISGRSDLSVEEGIRVDVYYVEDWSLFGDLFIIAGTLGVLLAHDGAY